MLSGCRKGCCDSSLLGLYNHVFINLLPYSLPTLIAMSLQNLEYPGCVEAQALCVCLSLLKRIFTAGIFVEPHATTPGAVLEQDTFQVHPDSIHTATKVITSQTMS